MTQGQKTHSQMGNVRLSATCFSVFPSWSPSDVQMARKPTPGPTQLSLLQCFHVPRGMNDNMGRNISGGRGKAFTCFKKFMGCLA
jgi:hypothetical protein